VFVLSGNDKANGPHMPTQWKLPSNPMVNAATINCIIFVG